MSCTCSHTKSIIICTYSHIHRYMNSYSFTLSVCVVFIHIFFPFCHRLGIMINVSPVFIRTLVASKCTEMQIKYTICHNNDLLSHFYCLSCHILHPLIISAQIIKGSSVINAHWSCSNSSINQPTAFISQTSESEQVYFSFFKWQYYIDIFIGRLIIRHFVLH